MDFVTLYNDFMALEPAYKFYFTIIFGGIIFLYKTFYGIYMEEDKQSLSIKLKAGEVLGKLEAAIAIYEKSDKERVDQDKLIEKMGECSLHLDWKVRQKIRLYYSNRSEPALRTLKDIISKKMDSYGNPGEEVLLVERIFEPIRRIFRPIWPLAAFIIILFVFFYNYIMFFQTDNFWAKVNIIASFFAVSISIIVGLTVLNIIIQKGFKLKKDKVVILYSSMIVFVSIIFAKMLVISSVIQFILIILLVRKK